MRRLLPLIALLLAGCATQPQLQAMSNNDDKASQAFSTYLSARSVQRAAPLTLRS